MSNFFDERPVVKAEDLRGPRVYSTDLSASLYDQNDEGNSLLIASRALKIKIITKGLVTLNCTHLVSPFGVRLLEKYPDVIAGDAILPAFRTDKSNLADYVEDAQIFEKAGITEKQLGDHIGLLSATVRQVMPWELADVGARFRDMVLVGLRSDHSRICRQLDQEFGFSRDDREKLASEIASLDFSTSANIREYVAKLPEGPRTPIDRFVTACYHMVGTNVVHCETGTDLSPLSNFKMEDVLLSGQQDAHLTDEAIFLELFLATALDKIQSIAIPSQIIDSLSFKHVHLLSGALRKAGFQEKYDQVIQTCLEAISKADKREALEAIEPGDIAAAVSELADTFEQEVTTEIPKYWTKAAAEAKSEAYQAGTDLAGDAAGAVPVLGTVVSVAGAMRNASNLTLAAVDFYEARDALNQAHERRNKRIRAVIDKLDFNGKAKLLDAAALLADVHVAAITRV
ncbi:hypothetical protein [Mesorhizobium sp. WSM3859]|uniref:hypothetical protein n=1 Tax=Mesorhizobium sp. WSM3859 TaxID=2029402 RepID=UPI001140B0DA|nr:hypothetical protein [Mesorhizobium sp. WSM3859]